MQWISSYLKYIYNIISSLVRQSQLYADNNNFIRYQNYILFVTRDVLIAKHLLYFENRTSSKYIFGWV